MVTHWDNIPFHIRPLSRQARELYARITRGDVVTAAAADEGPLEELRSCQLVTADPDQPDLLVPLDPQEAGRRYLQAGLQDLADRAQRMAAIPDAADELAVHYERARQHSDEGFEFLPEPELVNARIEVAIRRAECELLTAQPGGPRTRKMLDIALDRDAEALQRGVTVRTLYRDSVRDDRVTRTWATLMTQKGSQFRTLASPFQRCIIVDRRQAFISDYAPGAHPNSAWHVRGQAMVGFVVAVFEDAWRRADVWSGDPRTVDVAAGTRTTRLQREILRDTAAGIEQRVTAKRLGVSLRSLSNEIRTLREMWAVQTLPELTYQWALCPERLIDEQPPLAA